MISVVNIHAEVESNSEALLDMLSDAFVVVESQCSDLAEWSIGSSQPGSSIEIDLALDCTDTSDATTRALEIFELAISSTAEQNYIFTSAPSISTRLVNA